MEHLTFEEGALVLSHAKKVLDEHINGVQYIEPTFPLIFLNLRGVFVTLTKNGELRGCIGFPYASLPLKDAIRDAACSAATRDPRFLPLSPDEMSDIKVEVTVLTDPKNLDVPASERDKVIEIGRHGLIIKGHGRSGLLLPQVPVEWNWTPYEFLDHLCMKAGLPKKSWLEPDVELLTFEGQIFNEKSE